MISVVQVYGTFLGGNNVEQGEWEDADLIYVMNDEYRVLTCI